MPGARLLGVGAGPRGAAAVGARPRRARRWVSAPSGAEAGAGERRPSAQPPRASTSRAVSSATDPTGSAPAQSLTQPRGHTSSFGTNLTRSWPSRTEAPKTIASLQGRGQGQHAPVVLHGDEQLVVAPLETHVGG